MLHWLFRVQVRLLQRYGTNSLSFRQALVKLVANFQVRPRGEQARLHRVAQLLVLPLQLLEFFFCFQLHALRLPRGCVFWALAASERLLQRFGNMLSEHCDLLLQRDGLRDVVLWHWFPLAELFLQFFVRGDVFFLFRPHLFHLRRDVAAAEVCVPEVFVELQHLQFRLLHPQKRLPLPRQLLDRESLRGTGGQHPHHLPHAARRLLRARQQRVVDQWAAVRVHLVRERAAHVLGPAHQQLPLRQRERFHAREEVLQLGVCGAGAVTVGVDRFGEPFHRLQKALHVAAVLHEGLQHREVVDDALVQRHRGGGARHRDPRLLLQLAVQPEGGVVRLLEPGAERFAHLGAVLRGQAFSQRGQLRQHLLLHRVE
mmetsp:Transcript_22223/g.56062  ORF Transcript_22223/g.56062 Transcript_22223/m.56062 type:complete len:371 (-) Transcript_22223:284-1396(-)